MRRVVAVVGRKGGAGKTTTALNLSGALTERGYDVTMVDLDPQSSLTRLVNRGIVPAVLELGPQAENRAARGAAAAASWLAAQISNEGVYIIDTPPQLGAILDAAVAVADRVILPTRLAQQDLDSLLDTLDHCRQRVLIVPNAVSRYKVHQTALQSLRAAFNGQTWAKEIPESVTILEACNAGLPVVMYKRRGAPATAYRTLAQEVLPA